MTTREEFINGKELHLLDVHGRPFTAVYKRSGTYGFKELVITRPNTLPIHRQMGDPGQLYDQLTEHLK